MLAFQITKYSHHFVVSGMSYQARYLTNRFTFRFDQFEWVRNGGSWVRSKIRSFCVYNQQSDEFRIHINALADYVEFMKSNNFSDDSFSIVERCDYTAAPFTFEFRPEYQPLGKQLEDLEYVSDSKNEHPSILLQTQTGGGKALPNETLVKVPNGWKQIGDLRIGDLVLSPYGHYTEVTAVYPQGKVQLYNMRFQDGREQESCGNHLWQIIRPTTDDSQHSSVMKTSDIVRAFSLNKNPRLYIPLTTGIDGDDIDLPIPPYSLGVILGDDRLNNPWRKTLYEHELMGNRSWERSIPEIYFNGSHNQRLAVLQGLLDTDGTVGENGNVTFDSSSEALADGVRLLAWSIGAIAEKSVRFTHYTYKGIKKKGRKSFRIFIRYKEPSKLFSSPIKRNRVNDNNQYASNLKLWIRDIQPSRQAEATCIKVSDPGGLFVIKDYLVTHNTFISLTCVKQRGLRLGVIIRPGFIEKWQNDLIKHTLISHDEIFLIQGGESIEEAINLASVGEYNYGVTLISNRTYQTWMREYETISGYSGYPIPPHQLLSHLQIGTRLIDEVHMDFHLMFKTDLYTNVKHAISLSAEINGDDSFENSMALLAYPENCRTKKQPFHKYVDTTLLTFCFKTPKKLRYQQGRNYNHIKLEESICRHIPTYNAYVKMILDNADTQWRIDYKPGDKLVIFVASVLLATKLTRDAQRYWPGKDVRRYVEQDPFENLMGGDVTITTLLSGGTGHDIPNLSTVALSNSVKATRSNIQGFGRLRYKEGRKRKFLYLACKDIPKQMEYDQAKRDLLRDKTLTFNAVHHPYMI